MTHRETLYANYEDALFTLMMDSVAQSEGERLLRENARLNQDPDAALSEPFLRRCRQTIDRAFAKKTRQTAGRTAKKVVKILPLVAAIIATLAVLAYAAFPEFRADVLNLLLQHNTKSINWSFTEDNEINGQSDDLESPNFSVQLPEGYVLAAYANNTQTEEAKYLNQNDETQSIIISVLHNGFAAVNTDAEDADYYEESMIQGYKSVLIVKDDLTYITWGDKTHPCYVTLKSTGLDLGTAKQIAESIVVQELQKN